MQVFASGSSACAKEIMALAIREMTKRLNQATILLFFFEVEAVIKISSFLLFISSATSENT